MQPGELIAERFEVEALAGEGGMGVVYRAKDRESGGRVALKLLRPHTSVAASARFLREAEILARLRHPAVVEHIAHGRTAEGALYLAMEWLEGEGLNQRLKRGPLEAAEAARLCGQAAEALALAHARRVIHRDIKPSNLFLTRAGGLKVLDFGIARLGQEPERLTQTGSVIGTVGYMSPEQARGEHEIDGRADIYALGCVLYECLAGRPPFLGRVAVALLMKTILEEPEPLEELAPEAPPALAALAHRMLAKELDGRPASAETVALQLEALASSGATARPSQPPARKARPAPALTRRERRVVSLVLALLDPESEAHIDRTMGFDESQHQLQVLRRTVEARGARFERLLDGTLAVISAGARPADGARSAASCALALRREVPGLRAVVATGRAEVGAARVMGDAIDGAASLLASSRRAAIVVDRATSELLAGRFDIDGEGVLTGRRATGSHPALPMQGRRSELRQLRGLCRDAFECREASLALVTGEVGMGKTHLVEALTAAVKDQAPLLIGRADAMADDSAYALIGDALRNWAQWRPGLSSDTWQARVRERLGARLSTQQRHLVAYLGEILGSRFPDVDDPRLRAARADARVMGDQIRAAFVGWLERQLEAGPLLWVLEDLQWADEPSLELVDAALTALADRPLAIVCSRRPGSDARLAGLRAHEPVELELEPLPEDAISALVRQELGEASDETVGALVERAEGQPLFASQLARAWREGREEAFPESMLGVVEARLARLSEDARLVLRAASVFGREFSEDGLDAVLEGTLATRRTREILEDLERERWLRVPGLARWSFAHAVVREAAYAMLTAADRRSAHRLAGRWLVREEGTSPAVIAQHLTLAGERAEAAPWLLRASEQALEGNALEDARGHAERGVEAGATGVVEGRLRSVLAELAGWRGDSVLALEQGQRALERLEEGSAAWFKALRAVLFSASRLGRDEVWERSAARVLATEAKDARAGAMRSQALTRVAFDLTARGRQDEAEAALQAAGSPDDAPDPQTRARILEMIGITASVRGDMADPAVLQAAVEAYEEAGDLRNGAMCRNNLALVRFHLGQTEAARALAETSLKVAVQIRLEHVRSACLQYLGEIHERVGALEAAIIAQEAAARAFETQQNGRMASYSRAALARLYRLQGDADRALAAARRATELARERPGALAVAKAGLLGALLLAGDRDAAAALAAELDAELDEGGHANFVGEQRVHLSLIEAFEALGEPARAARAADRGVRAVQKRARAIRDDALREGFLRDVPETAALLRAGRGGS